MKYADINSILGATFPPKI